MSLTKAAKTAGLIAEQIACDYLTKQGLRLLTKNFRCPSGEIDLIMQEKEDIIFIEVRSRKSLDFGQALESIDAKKIKKIIKTASFYLQSRQLTHQVAARFDVVSLQWDKKDWKIEWIKNAFTT